MLHSFGSQLQKVGRLKLISPIVVTIEWSEIPHSVVITDASWRYQQSRKLESGPAHNNLGIENACYYSPLRRS